MIEYSLHIPIQGGKGIEYVTEDRVQFDAFRDKMLQRFPSTPIYVFVREMPDPPLKPIQFFFRK